MRKLFKGISLTWSMLKKLAKPHRKMLGVLDIGLQPDSLLQCGYRSAYYFKSVSGPGNAGCKRNFILHVW